MFIEGTKAVFLDQPNNLFGLRVVNIPPQVRDTTTLLTIIREQHLKTFREVFAHPTVLALDRTQPCIEIFLKVEEGIFMSRPPEGSLGLRNLPVRRVKNSRVSKMDASFHNQGVVPFRHLFQLRDKPWGTNVLTPFLHYFCHLGCDGLLNDRFDLVSVLQVSGISRVWR